VAYTHTPAGRLQRLSAAVVIDNLRATDADGKVTETPIPEDQIARITTLVRDAVGFDEARGDRVSVVNQSFLPEAVAETEIETTPIWENPLVLNIAKILAGLIVVVLLLLMVIRPLVRNLATPMRTAFESSGPGAMGGQPNGGGQPIQQPMVARSTNSMAYEQQIAQARSLVAKDPARVAQVVKEWVQKDD